MEPLAVDDDICILKHETAYGVAGESPVSVCAGDESVASHFALVTAYEDIKKRLRDTERENTLLRKRVKQLEDKVSSTQETGGVEDKVSTTQETGGGGGQGEHHPGDRGGGRTR